MKVWNLITLLVAAFALCAGCAEEKPLSAEESAAQVREANEAVMNSPTSGAANPEAAASEGP